MADWAVAGIARLDCRLAHALLQGASRRCRTRYTIETRPLTRESTPRPYNDGPGPAVIEATDAGEALSTFARDQSSEVMSFQPVTGRESIGTVRWHDDVFLVRVYAD